MNPLGIYGLLEKGGLVLLNIIAIAIANAYSQSEPWPARIIF